MRSDHLPIDHARALLADARTVLVLTGAGVSAESGVPTFRGVGGLWKSYRAAELATPAAFARDPRLVWEWYAWRRALVAECAPNAAHQAIARLLAAHPDVTLATQNVDGLHQRAAVGSGVSGAGCGVPRHAPSDLDSSGPVGTDQRRPGSPDPALLELHGSLFRVRCTRCPHAAPHHEPVDTSSVETLPRCPRCGALLRPGVVWFGEALDAAVLGAAMRAAERAEVCLVVGTSAAVQPAASLATITLRSAPGKPGGRGRMIEVNPAETPLSALADVVLRGAAGEIVPALV